MNEQIICIPVAEDGQIAHSWGKARTVALATVSDVTITSWRTQTVNWDVSKQQATEGAHHARVARFIKDNAVTDVIARHMGEGMQNMLKKLGTRVHQGATGDARTATTSL
ncbi:MAG: NifB/NifX family molybdenum-iron cluster-binding protein [Brooklawnia sp.]|jgi:predicted Fe-Mo cluster-binding NifX family protein